MERNGFARGLIVGGMLGASLSMMMNPDTMRGRSRRRIMRGGKGILRRSGSLLGDVIGFMK
ncbi:MAG TPA: YtxH domain-containing protein [Clostridia bacterium]